MKKILLGLTLLLAACAPREQAFSPPHQPPQLAAGELQPGDGSVLPLRHWEPKGRPKAVVVALHGFNDYSRSFERVAKYFARRGIETYAYDQRGFGSTPERGIWAGEENLVSDLRQAVSAVQEKHPKTPLFLLGDSMGCAVIVAALVSENPPPAKGVVMVAPAVWGGPYFVPPLRLSLWVGAHSFPFHELTGKGLRVQASDNIPMLIALGRDPLILKSTRIDAIYGLVHLMDHAYMSAEKLSVPMLVLYGDKDQVIPRRPVEDFVERLQAPYTFIEYDGGWHMLMRDLNAKEVWKDEADWLLEQARRRD